MLNNTRLTKLFGFLSDIQEKSFIAKENELYDLLDKVEHNNPYHLEGNVLVHTNKVRSIMIEEFKYLYEVLDYSKLLLYVISTFHDAGKAFTMNNIQKDDYNHFYEHELLSGVIVEQLLKFCKNPIIDNVKWIPFIKQVIKLHMLNPSAMKMDKRNKLILDLQKFYNYLLMLKYSDVKGMIISDEISKDIRDNIILESEFAKEEVIKSIHSNSNNHIDFGVKYYNTIKEDEILSYFKTFLSNKKTFIVLIGTPLSGKSTIRKKLIDYFSSQNKSIDVLSRDDMRFEISGNYNIDKKVEKQVLLEFQKKLREFETNECDILISDNTNKTDKVRIPQIDRLKNSDDYDIIYIYIDHIPLVTKVENSIKREDNPLWGKLILEHQAILTHPIVSHKERYIKNLSILEII